MVQQWSLQLNALRANKRYLSLDSVCSTALHAVRPMNLMVYNLHIQGITMVQQWSLQLNALVPNKTRTSCSTLLHRLMKKLIAPAESSHLVDKQPPISHLDRPISYRDLELDHPFEP